MLENKFAQHFALLRLQYLLDKYFVFYFIMIVLVVSFVIATFRIILIVSSVYKHFIHLFRKRKNLK